MDYRGQLCGLEQDKSSDGTSLQNFETLYYSMNVTKVLDDIVEPYFSSSNDAPFDPAAVGTEMETLLDPYNLYVTYGDGLISDIPAYFNSVCTSSCEFNTTSTSTGTRTYVWTGPADPTMTAKWDQYKAAAALDASLMLPFTFTALPSAVCPYEAENCIPLQFSEVASLFDKYCLPVGSASVGAFVTEKTNEVVDTDFGSLIGDVGTSWKLILIMAFGSLLISLVFLWILRLCVGVFVWLAIIAGFLLIIASAVLALLYAQKCVGQSVFQSASSIDSEDAVLSLLSGTSVCTDGFSISSESSRTAIQICGYVLFGLAGLYLILILIFRKRIRLAVAINKVASQFIRQNKRTMLVPSLQTIILIGWWALWLVVTVYALTIVPDGYRNMTATWVDDYPQAVAECGHSESAVIVQSHTVLGAPIYACKEVKYILNWQFWYSIGFLFWLNAIILGAGEMIVAGAVGVWYFTPNHAKGTLGGYPLRIGFRNTFIYHLGTVAFGALILAIIRLIRIALFWAIKLKERGVDPTSKMARCLLVPLYLLVDFIHKIVNFLSRNAFVQTALMGTNFCRSCSSAFDLIASNPVRLGALHVTSLLVEFIGLVFITAGTGFSGWALLLQFYDGQIKSPLLPVIIISLTGFGIGLIVISLFSMSVTAILQCFLIDEEVHKLEGGAKFTPSLLQRFLSSVEARAVGVHSQQYGLPQGPVGGQPISIVQSN
jgi:hypothetical protein